MSWRRVGSGLYAWAGLAPNPALELAAVLRRMPAEAVLSGRSPAWLHGLDVVRCDPIEVTIPPGCGVSGRTGVVVRRAELEDDDVVERQGMRLTSGLRTVAELGSRLDLVDAVAIVDMALQKRLLALPELREYAALHGRRAGHRPAAKGDRPR
jgi:hypothetical protein